MQKKMFNLLMDEKRVMVSSSAWFLYETLQNERCGLSLESGSRLTAELFKSSFFVLWPPHTSYVIKTIKQMNSTGGEGGECKNAWYVHGHIRAHTSARRQAACISAHALLFLSAVRLLHTISCAIWLFEPFQSQYRVVLFYTLFVIYVNV